MEQSRMKHIKTSNIEANAKFQFFQHMLINLKNYVAAFVSAGSFEDLMNLSVHVMISTKFFKSTML